MRSTLRIYPESAAKWHDGDTFSQTLRVICRCTGAETKIAITVHWDPENGLTFGTTQATLAFPGIPDDTFLAALREIAVDLREYWEAALSRQKTQRR